MLITQNNASDIIELLKSGKTIYIRSGGNDDTVFDATYDAGTGKVIIDGKWPYIINDLIGVAFWNYELVNSVGDAVDISYYESSDVDRSVAHPHYDLIVKWAADPANVKIQWLNNSNFWVDVAEPAWLSKCEYRIKPTKPTLYRQVIYTVNSEVPTHHLISLDKYARFDDFASEEITIVGWYDATAEERFE